MFLIIKNKTLLCYYPVQVLWLVVSRLLFGFQAVFFFLFSLKHSLLGHRTDGDRKLRLTKSCNSLLEISDKFGLPYTSTPDPSLPHDSKTLSPRKINLVGEEIDAVYPIRSAGFAGFAGSWAIVTNALALSYLTTCGIIEERIDSHLRTLTLTHSHSHTPSHGSW